jgi:hypothetical protein
MLSVTRVSEWKNAPIHQTSRKWAFSNVCSSLRASGCSVTRCNIQNTKQFEIRFRAVLVDRTREVRFERGIG